MRSVVPWILVASPIAISSFGCWGATQVTVVLSTDLPCDGAIDTVLYKGLPQSLDANPNAETKSCTIAVQVGADNDIGTLTLTPSGDKNAQVEVKAVLARNGKDPAKCTTADSTDCIVATRTFSFSEHASQRVSIRLLADCIGTVCPDGQTCVSAGVCTADTTTCTDPDGCSANDAGADDGGGGGVCETRGKSKDGILARTSKLPGDQLSTIVRTQSGSRSAIVYFGADKLLSVFTDGSAEPVQIAIAGSPAALTDSRDGRFAAVVSKPPALVRGQQATTLSGVGDASTVAATKALAIIGGASGVYFYDPSASAGPVNPGGGATSLASASPATRVATTDRTAFAASADGIHVFTVAGKTELPQLKVALGPMGSSSAIFAVNPGGGHAFAAGVSQEKIVIADLALAGVTDPFRPTGPLADAPIVSLATDDKYVYFTHGPDGITGVDSDHKTVVASAVSGTIAHVAVDDTCLYFWQVEGPSSAVLRAVTKPK